jgi:hypothetical protein
MPVTAAEVDELRAAGEARGLDDADRTLETYPEIIAFAVHVARSHGWDVNDYVELLVRATGLPREDIRQARDVLQALNYPRDLCQLMTRLARRAKPKTRWSGRTASAEHRIAPRRAERTATSR